jgi:acyl-[acyl-carrier-protein]-phospholipid O-acyltransferase/long-chain-fatty-acid--[acyl-carrier-protein] ligase
MGTAQPGVAAAGLPAWWAASGPGQTALVVSLCLLAALLLFACLRTRIAFRLALRCWVALLYRVRVTGLDRLPRRGGALLVCNSVGHLDWLLLLAVQPRPVRFVLLAPWTRHTWLRRLARWTGAFMTGAHAGPRDLARALRRARRAVAAGEVVCLFVESYRTAAGFSLPFARAFRRAARGLGAPVLPVCLDQPRGTLFPLFEGLPSFRRPIDWRNPVDLAFGEPLPPATGPAAVVAAQRLLSAGRALARAHLRRPVHRQFVRIAARHPFRPCIIDSSQPGRTLSYARALAGVHVLRRLLGRRLGDAPVAALWLPPSAGGALANITLAVLGKTSVNLNYTGSPDAVRAALHQCGARHVVTSRRFTDRLPLPAAEGVEPLYLEDFVAQVGRVRRLAAYLTALLLPGWVQDRWVLGLGRHGTDELATVIFSSGSTGEAKGVMLSHGNIAANVESILQAIALAPQDRALGVLPFFHSFGYTVTLWAPLQVGASVVYHADPRQAKEIGELCRRHRCTLYLSTATFLRFCLRRCEPDDFRSLRVLIAGAEKLPACLAEEFEAKFGVLPLEGYGCTELSPVVGSNLPDVRANGLHLTHNRPGSIGEPLPGLATRVAHPETLEPLGAGEEGVLLVKGANVMRGYLGRPDLTRQAVRDGWYVTGDMARLDEDGYVTLTGRLSRFAKCGGEMVPLERVEDVLHEILGTTERVCAVTCVPDEARGERVVVLYTPHAGLDVRPWQEQLGSRGLPKLWLPSERDFFAVPELPLLGSGKLNLQRVKELALELAALPRRSRRTG